jgi:hypothetical protein
MNTITISPMITVTHVTSLVSNSAPRNTNIGLLPARTTALRLPYRVGDGDGDDGMVMVITIIIIMVLVIMVIMMMMLVSALQSW